MANIKENSKKENRGGKREGAGRRPNDPTTAFFCRVDSEILKQAKEKYPDLNDKFKDWLSSLIDKA